MGKDVKVLASVDEVFYVAPRRRAYREGYHKCIDDLQTTIIDMPSKMVINDENYYSEHELAKMLKQLVNNADLEE